MAGRRRVSRRSGVSVEPIGYSEFIACGEWDVDHVLRQIYEESSEVLGREFKYPGDEYAGPRSQ